MISFCSQRRLLSDSSSSDSLINVTSSTLSPNSVTSPSQSPVRSRSPSPPDDDEDDTGFHLGIYITKLSRNADVISMPEITFTYSNVGAKIFEQIATSSSDELLRLSDFWTLQRDHHDVTREILRHKKVLRDGRSFSEVSF